MQPEGKNEALKLIAKSILILQSWEIDSTCRIEEASCLLREAIEKLST